MSASIAFAEAGFEPIPGYVLREKIGSGGFGEVWLADAPGGLKKALKLVYGSIDEDRAAGELKSLQRIRAVNHPFVLSLERIEVISGQLIVVTELADGSLLDRFREMRKRDLVGIPRERLLGYLSDAADALDFLCQHHDLQHLDVKPANLLLLADRIKLADFGLIKDVQRTVQSAIGGLTPTYAAPEMFDGRPGRFSDQYALAIVYQEMLTGILPFSGRTTAQLAAQHLHKAPNLEPLPIEDRAIIAKGLSKKPGQRFATCRAMIDALCQSDVAAAEGKSAANKSIPRRSTNAAAGPQEPATATLGVTPPRGSRTAAVNIGGSTSKTPPASSRVALPTDPCSVGPQPNHIVTLPPLQPSATPAVATPRLFIGVGQTGIQALLECRHRLASAKVPQPDWPTTQWLAIDTDGETLSEACEGSTAGALDPGQTLYIPLRDARDYRVLPREHFAPISRRWLYNIPRSRSTEGVRSLGMLALLSHSIDCYHTIYHQLADAIAAAQDLHPEASAESITPHIYLVASAHGGTGSAVLWEIGLLVRRAIAELSGQTQQDYQASVVAVLTTANCQQASLEMAAGSATVCLHELRHLVDTSGLHPGLPMLPRFPLSVAPVDDLYLIHGGRFGHSGDYRDAIAEAAEFLTADAFSPLGAALLSCRRRLRSDEAAAEECHPWLRTTASAVIQLSDGLPRETLARHWTCESLQHWSTAFDRVAEEQAAALRHSDAATGETNTRPRRANQAIELFCDDLFRDACWNAQAWVRGCFAMLLPIAQSSAPQTQTLDALSTADDPELIAAITQVAETLKILPAEAYVVAHELINRSLRGLNIQLQEQWGNRPGNWAHLESLLQRIIERLQRHAESVRSVTHRFASQLAGAEHAAAKQPGPPPDELNTLRLQFHVHHLAGLLLLQLAAQIDRRRQVWHREADRLRSELRGHRETLRGGEVDESNHAQPLPLASGWSKIRQFVHEAIDAELNKLTSLRLQKAWDEAESRRSTDSESFRSGPASDRFSAGITPLPAQLIDTAAAALQTAATRANMRTDAAKHCSSLNLHSLQEAVRDTLPPLLSGNAAKRVILLLPSDYQWDEDTSYWPPGLQQQLSIFRSGTVDRPRLIVDGEGMLVEDVLQILWPPTAGRRELLPRLQSRIDIDWT